VKHAIQEQGRFTKGETLMKNNIWKKIVANVALAATASLITVETSSAADNSVFDNVLSTGAIRACYVVAPPSIIKDPNTGKLSGVGFEVLEQVAKNLGLKLSWTTEVGWVGAMEALNTDKCDILGTAVWGNANRAKAAEFIQPIFYSAINAYVRGNDTRFDKDITVANDSKITLAVNDGSATYVIAARQFPNAKLERLSENTVTSVQILEVVSGKADMTFGEASQVKGYQKNNPGKVKQVLNAKPVAIFEDVFLVKKGELKLKSTIDSAIRELLYVGFVDKVLNDYEKEKDLPGVFYRVASPYVIPQQ
jgi:ABC-type amino acid transport substrate-binding protein